AISAGHELALPERTLQTKAVWWTSPQTVLDGAEVASGDLPGAVHAAEHASIGLLPLFAGCDRWDIGGVSTALHADTGLATVFVYEGWPEEPASPNAAARSSRTGCRRRGRPSRPANASTGARPACSHRNAETATSPWTRTPHCVCCAPCS